MTSKVGSTQPNMGRVQDTDWGLLNDRSVWSMAGNESVNGFRAGGEYTAETSDVPRLQLKRRNPLLVLYGRMSSALQRGVRQELGGRQKTFWKNRRGRPSQVRRLVEQNWQLDNLKV